MRKSCNINYEIIHKYLQLCRLLNVEELRSCIANLTPFTSKVSRPRVIEPTFITLELKGILSFILYRFKTLRPVFAARRFFTGKNQKQLEKLPAVA